MQKRGFETDVESDVVRDGANDDDDEQACVEWIDCEEEYQDLARGCKLSPPLQIC